MALVAYDGWTGKREKYKGIHRAETGYGLSGLYMRIQKHNVTMCFLNNGHNLRSYKYPRVEVPFKSSMHSWRNLFFCGGYTISDIDEKNLGTHELLLETVLANKKPIGFIVCYKDEVDKFINRIKEVNNNIQDKNKQFIYHINTMPAWNKYVGPNTFVLTERVELAVACPGKVKEYFDLDKLIKSYELFHNKYKQFRKIKNDERLLDEEDVHDILELKEHYLSDFLTDWDYANPHTDFEVIKTGLLLGYPIESTFSIITQ